MLMKVLLQFRNGNCLLLRESRQIQLRLVNVLTLKLFLMLVLFPGNFLHQRVYTRVSVRLETIIYDEGRFVNVELAANVDVGVR